MLTPHPDAPTAGGARDFGDRVPVRARYSAPVQTDPEVHTASYAEGTRSFPG